MSAFLFCAMFACAIFVGVIRLLAVLDKLGFGLWMVIINLGLLGMFASLANDMGSSGAGVACVYLFIAVIINLVMISAHAQISTEEGREEMRRQLKAQKEYDSKNRNFVQEAKNKKGTIEYTEKKR